MLVYHITELGWLTVVFPAMGVMFAIGGSLTTRSLVSADGAANKPASRTTTAVVVDRFRRLLPSVWVFGAVGVVASIGPGWGTGDGLRDNLGLLWWFLPLASPTGVGSDNAWAFTAGVWYLTAYLWFVLLTPTLRRLLQSWPRATLVVALALPVVLHLEVLTIGGALHPQAYDVAQYAACWLIGIAHRELWLARVPGPLLWSAVGGLGLTALSWLFVTDQTVSTVDLHQMPMVNALWSAAFAAALLRLGSSGGRTTRLLNVVRHGSVVASALRAVNARALTIYLWHFPCLVLARWLTGFDPASGPWLWPTAVLAVAGTALATLIVGWVEDIAARRPVSAPWHLPGRPAGQRNGSTSDGER